MRRRVDAAIVGSGHNALVAAAYLARAGWEVEVFERNDRPGGAVATEELTAPGFRHDTFSSWHPLFHLSAAYAELGEELASRGLEYVNTGGVVTASVAEGAPPILADRDPAKTVEAFPDSDAAAYAEDLESFGAQMDIIGELLATELHSAAAVSLALRLLRRLGPSGTRAFAAQALSSARGWLTTRFEGDEVARLLAPWVLHTGLTPDDANSGFQVLALAGALHEVGLPVVRGGSSKFVDAFVSLIEDNGGRLRTGAEVERITIREGRAAGVVVGGEEIGARRAVIANTTPTQLYGRLLPAEAAPPRANAEASRFRYGARSGAQIHLALSEPLRWRDDERLGETPVVHVTDGLDAVGLACAQARSGLLPAEPTVVCGQPTALDPGRAPEGKAILWIQLQEVPHRPRGDAAGQIDVGDGSWTEGLDAAYAERILERLSAHVSNLPGAIESMAMLSPAAIEERNPNMVHGDIYAGATDLAQSFLWRPLPAFGSHRTPVPGLFQCGASTHPGPGLNAASGRIVAMRLLRRSLPERLGSLLRGAGR